MTRYLLLILLLTIAPMMLFSQVDDIESAPSWLLMEMGERAFQNKEFGEALNLFREVKRKEGIYPEADIWIGLVFEADAETELAIKQLELAYSHRNQLFVLAEKYTILYKLAELHKRMSDYSAFEDRLEEIISDDGDWISVKMEVLVRILQERGLNDLLKLYRFTSDFSIDAHLRLGTFLHESGRNPQGINHLLFAVITMYSRSIQFLREEDPEYAFTSTSDFFRLASEYDELETYFSKAGLFPGMYVLAKALDDTGHVGVAKSLLEIVGEFGTDLSLRSMARKDLRS